SVRILPGSDAEILLVLLIGHTRGHTGVAVRRGDGSLLHCGDAFFNAGAVETPARSTPLLTFFQLVNSVDNATRRQNAERLRELARRGDADVELFCSHDPAMLAHHQGASASRL